MLKAMSHSERLAILLALEHNECSLQELAEKTEQNIRRLSAHLSKMRQLGMVDYTRFMWIIQNRITSETVKRVLKILPH